MSSTTLDPPVVLRPLDTASGVTVPRVIRSEWLKLRTLRSSWYTLAGAAVAMILIGLLIASATGKNGATLKPVDLAASGPLRGFYFAQLLVAVLGVLFVSSEYGTGQIRSTLAAVPRRWQVLQAKSVVFGGVVFGVMTVASFITYFAAQGFLSHSHHGTSLSDPGALRAVVGTGIYLALVGVLGGAMGWIVRSTAGGIAAVLGLLLVVPLIASALPGSLGNTVTEYLPSMAGGSFASSIHTANSLSSGAGLAVLCLWVAAALAVGGVLLHRRDA
jgi:ABC-2 type transport system permease protein